MVSFSSRHNITDVQGQERGLTQTLRLRFFDGGFRSISESRHRSFAFVQRWPSFNESTDDYRQSQRGSLPQTLRLRLLRWRIHSILDSRHRSFAFLQRRLSFNESVREDRYHKRYDYAFFDEGFVQFQSQYWSTLRHRSFAFIQ